jgi:hypothetical protein
MEDEGRLLGEGGKITGGVGGGEGVDEPLRRTFNLVEGYLLHSHPGEGSAPRPPARLLRGKQLFTR